jgi:pyruvate oxidase
MSVFGPAGRYGGPASTCSATASSDPDFSEFARLCGATGLQVLDEAMKQLFAADGPATLHVHTDPELA